MIKLLAVWLTIALILFIYTFGPLYLVYLILSCTAVILAVYIAPKLVGVMLFVVFLPLLALFITVNGLTSFLLTDRR